MNNFFTTFSSFFTKHGTQVSGVYRKKAMRPGSDWKMIIGVIFACTLVTGLVHVFIYTGVKESKWWKVDTTNTVQQIKINKKLLENALDRFAAQKEKMKVLRENPSKVADPSL
ncbi:MAG: hypothetical protein NTV02_01940 [Candidatus Zambryskibacteria bacterium]|nr:hypothetical protein [Candidatus Zambryskibacteria bacterium]